MEYFTRAWGLGELADDEADRVVASYRAYLSSLPATSAVYRFAESLSLNDAWVDRLDASDGSIRLRLLTGDLQRGYWHTEIQYIGGQITCGREALERAVKRRPTEIWYDEFSGCCPDMVHRFTLVQAHGTEDRGEVHITFVDFEFTETPAEARMLPPA